MATYYFSSTGNDSNAGTEASPFLSIAKANTLLSGAVAGDVFLFKGGQTFTVTTTPLTITSRNGTLTSPIKISSYGTGRATIAFPKTTHGISLTSSNYIRIENIDVTSNNVGTLDTTKAAIFETGCTNNVISSIKLTGGTYGVQLVNTQFECNYLEVINSYGVGINVSGTSTATIRNYVAYQVGYTVSSGVYTANTVGSIELAAIRVTDSGSATVSNAYITECQVGIFTNSTSATKTKLYRVFMDQSLTGQRYGVWSGVPVSGTTQPLVLRDSIMRLSGSHLVQAVFRNGKGQVDVTNCTIVSVNTNGSSAVFDNQPIAATPYSKFTTKNCLAVINPSALAATAQANHYFVNESASVNASAIYEGVTNNFAYVQKTSSPLTTPFKIGATSYSLAQWVTAITGSPSPLRETNSLQLNVINQLSPGALGPEIALLAPGFQSGSQYNNANSPLINAGTDIQTTYNSEFAASLDYFGTPRYPGYSGYWSIGAYENTTRPSIELFNEGTFSGAASASLESPANIKSRAVLLTTSAFNNFPKVSYYVESKVRLSGDVKKAGIFALAGAPQYLAVTSTPSFDIYQYLFQSGSPAVNLTSEGSWYAYQTPGYNDDRGVSFTIDKDPSGTGRVATIECLFSGVGSFTSSAPLTGSLFPGDGVDHTLRLDIEHVSSTESTHTFKFKGYINDTLVLEIPDRTFTDSYITGVGYAPEGLFSYQGTPANLCGIIGERSNTGSFIYWRTIRGYITSLSGGTVNTLPISARYKEFMSGRESALNLIQNGGFTSYPAPLEPVIKYKSVRFTPSQLLRTDPKVNVVFIIPTTDALQTAEEQGQTWQHIKKCITSCIANCPLDASVQLTILAHGEGGDDGISSLPNQVAANNDRLRAGTYGRIFNNVYTNLRYRGSENDKSAYLSAFGGPSVVREDGRWNTTFPNGLPNACVIRSFRGSNAAKKMIVIFDHNESFPSISSSEGLILPPDRLLTELETEFPGLTDIIGINTGSNRTPTQMASSFRSILYPRLPNTANLVDGVDFNDAIMPNGTKPIVLSISDHTNAPSPFPRSTPVEAAEQIGIDLSNLIKRRISEATDSTETTPVEGIQVPTKVLTKVPGRAASIAVFADKPTESELGEWFVYGCSGSVDISPNTEAGPLFSYDGGNVAAISFAESGTIQVTQTIVDIKPMLGRYITASYSGYAIRGRATVSLVLRIDGEDKVIDQISSSSFGPRLRRAASYELPLNFNSLELVISARGSRSDSFGLSGVSMTLGRLEKDLPFSDNQNSGIPAGTVIMYSGSSCPPGYRTVPYSKDRLAFLTSSTPYELAVDRTVVIDTQEAQDAVTVDLVLYVDTGGYMNQAGAHISLWITTVLDNLPSNGSVFLSIVASDGARAGHVVVSRQQFTLLNKNEIGQKVITDILNRLNPQVTIITTTSNNSYFSSYAPYINYGVQDNRGAKSIQAGFNAVKTVLQSSTSRSKLLFMMTDNSYPRSARITLPSEITGFVESTVALAPVGPVNGGTNPDYYVYPLPVNNSPGELIDAVSTPGGAAALGSFFGQKTVNAVVRELNRPVVAESLINIDRYDTELPPYLGGQKKHDHVSISAQLANIEDSDGFEPASTETTSTLPLLPRESTASIAAYRYGSLDVTGRRAEDEPVFAIGVAHRHNFQSDMTALPPSFPILFCEKL